MKIIITFLILTFSAFSYEYYFTNNDTYTYNITSVENGYVYADEYVNDVFTRNDNMGSESEFYAVTTAYPQVDEDNAFVNNPYSISFPVDAIEILASVMLLSLALIWVALKIILFMRNK